MTSSKHITKLDRDGIRESNFKSAYKFPVKIKSTCYNDEDWNWNKVVLNFTCPLGKTYGLIEYYKEGADNSTDHVDFEYSRKDNTFHVETFKTFVEAERAMVDLMIKRQKGED